MVRQRLVDQLTELDPTSYASKVVYEGKSKVLYLEVLRAIYGMLVASLLWYRKIKADLEQEGFKFNPYDQCIENFTYKNHQQTIRLHVDDMLVSCKNKKANDEFHQWCEKTYGGLKPVKCIRGGVHQFLGMDLDFKRSPGSCHVIQDQHVSDLIETFCNKTKLKGRQLTKSGGG